MAASATFALKAGVWFRRGPLFIVSPDSLGTACPLSGRNSTYRPVQILEAGSGFFAKLTRQRLKRGVFQSVVDLQLAINRFVAETNADPKPFVWTADPKRVLAAVKRGKQVLESIH